jgi:hypothetical protein
LARLVPGGSTQTHYGLTTPPPRNSGERLGMFLGDRKNDSLAPIRRAPNAVRARVTVFQNLK